jgi:hypothetical protein
MATFTGQKAKMLAGELYIASDPELAADHLPAQALLAKFNATATDAEEERRLLLVQLLGRIGEGTMLKPYPRCDCGHNIAIGDRTFVNYDCVLLDCNRITIGNEVQIAAGVHIYTATHPVEAQLRRSGGPVHRLSRRRSQYGGGCRQRGYTQFAVQCGGSRKSLSRHPAPIKIPGPICGQAALASVSPRNKVR